MVHFCRNVVVNTLVNTLPSSDWILLGNPTCAKMDKRASMTSTDNWSHKGTASGNLVAGHTVVNNYLKPSFVAGSGPTMSVTTLRKGSVIIGTAVMGALHF